MQIKLLYSFHFFVSFFHAMLCINKLFSNIKKTKLKMAKSAAFYRSVHTFSYHLFTRSPAFWRGYHLDLVITTAYSLPRLLFLSYVLHQSKSNKSAFWFDPLTNAFSNFDPLMGVQIALFTLFHACALRMATQIEPSSPVWRFWAEVIVHLPESYFRCALEPTDRAQVEAEMTQRLRQKYPLTSIFFRLLPKKIINRFAGFLVWARLGAIDQKRFYKQTEKLFNFNLPPFSKLIRRRAVLLLLASDEAIYRIQYLVGKF